MDKRLNNKVAIVTGGAAGIGEAISKKFALNGAKVVVCGLTEDPVDEVVREIKSKGDEATAFKGNIAVAANAQACVQRAIDTYGKLDILINNAGVFPAVGFIEEWPLEKLDYLIQNNIYSAVMMTRAAMPYLQKTKGCVVSAGSEAGIDGDAQNSPYSGTKGFIHSFTRSIAAEQAQHGVRANVVCPGPIDTAWTNDESSPMTVKMEKLFISATPMGRRGTPEEVANVYLFLASDEASYVTGALYAVDGGITISKGPIGMMADKAMKKEPEGELDLKHSKEGDSVRHVGKEQSLPSSASATASGGSSNTTFSTNAWDDRNKEAISNYNSESGTGSFAQQSVSRNQADYTQQSYSNQSYQAYNNYTGQEYDYYNNDQYDQQSESSWDWGRILGMVGVAVAAGLATYATRRFTQADRSNWDTSNLDVRSPLAGSSQADTTVESRDIPVQSDYTHAATIPIERGTTFGSFPSDPMGDVPFLNEDSPLKP